MKTLIQDYLFLVLIFLMFAFASLASMETGAVQAPQPTAVPAQASDQPPSVETIALAEDKPALLQSGNQQVAILFQSAEAPLGEMTKTLNDLIKMREEMYKRYFEIDATIDSFIQESGLSKGALTEPVDQKK